MIYLLTLVMILQNNTTPSSQVTHLLKAQEDNIKQSIPSVLQDVAPKQSPTKLLQDYNTTGNEQFKYQAGQALNKLNSFADNAVIAASKIVPSLIGASTYDRQQKLAEISPSNIPQPLQDPIFRSVDELVTPRLFSRLMSVENQPADTHAIRHNSDGSRDLGLFQINTSNIPWIQKQFKAQNLIFDPFDPTDNAKAASMLLHDNAKKFTASVERLPTEDELLGTYHLGLNEIIQAAKGDIAAQKKENDYVAKAVSHD